MLTAVNVSGAKCPRVMSGFDLYWFAVALYRGSKFPDEIERWPVKMRIACDPVTLKRSFRSLAPRIMENHTG